MSEHRDHIALQWFLVFVFCSALGFAAFVLSARPTISCIREIVKKNGDIPETVRDVLRFACELDVPARHAEQGDPR